MDVWMIDCQDATTFRLLRFGGRKAIVATAMFRPWNRVEPPRRTKPLCRSNTRVNQDLRRSPGCAAIDDEPQPDIGKSTVKKAGMDVAEKGRDRRAERSHCEEGKYAEIRTCIDRRIAPNPVRQEMMAMNGLTQRAKQFGERKLDGGDAKVGRSIVKQEGIAARDDSGGENNFGDKAVSLVIGGGREECMRCSFDDAGWIFDVKQECARGVNPDFTGAVGRRLP